MTLPVEAYRDPLHRETTDIAEGLKPGVEFASVYYMEGDELDNSDRGLIRTTNVHMVPGETSPRLRKVDFPHPEIPAPAALEREVAAGCMRHLVHLRPDISEAVADSAAQAVREICAGIDNEPQSTEALFKTIGVLGMYATAEGEPLVRAYISTLFLFDMSARVSAEVVAGMESLGVTDDIRGQITVETLGKLLLPRELTHPRIQAALFE